jgi:hypothetical protein
MFRHKIGFLTGPKKHFLFQPQGPQRLKTLFIFIAISLVQQKLGNQI